MEEKKDVIQESTSIIEEIEQQLESLLTKKKEEVDRELEEKIRKEEEEAKRKHEDIEKEFLEEKTAVINYRDILTEFEVRKTEIKEKIKVHLDKAIELQPKISAMAQQTLEELKKVSELNQELESIQLETIGKVDILKKDLETKYGITVQVPKMEKEDNQDVQLKEELSKLEKIKELLGEMENTDEISQDREFEPEAQPEPETVTETRPEPEAEPDRESETQPESEPITEPESTPEAESELEQIKPLGPEEFIRHIEEKSGNSFGEAVRPPVVEDESFHPPLEEDKPEFQPSTEMEPETGSESEEKRPEVPPDFSPEMLEKFRKKSEEMSYFENAGRIVLDPEEIIASLNKSLEEARKLYVKLGETESPKEQFFVKQEIIWHQEVLRELMLSSLRMIEKEICNLPKFTSEIFNTDVMKTILEKVSMENWSNKEYFAAFEDYANDLKDSFFAKITPPELYYASIYEELTEV